MTIPAMHTLGLKTIENVIVKDKDGNTLRVGDDVIPYEGSASRHTVTKIISDNKIELNDAYTINPKKVVLYGYNLYTK